MLHTMQLIKYFSDLIITQVKHHKRYLILEMAESFRTDSRFILFVDRDWPKTCAYVRLEHTIYSCTKRTKDELWSCVWRLHESAITPPRRTGAISDPHSLSARVDERALASYVYHSNDRHARALSNSHRTVFCFFALCSFVYSVCVFLLLHRDLQRRFSMGALARSHAWCTGICSTRRSVIIVCVCGENHVVFARVIYVLKWFLCRCVCA